MEPNERDKTLDEILQEVRRVKAELAAAKHFNIERMVEDARRKQYESGREIISPLESVRGVETGMTLDEIVSIVR